MSSYQRQKRQEWVDKHYPGKPNNDAKPTIFDKLRKESRCFGCGEDLHKPGVSCPCKNPVCRNCKTKGHIESVCVKSQTTKHQTYNKSHLHTKRWRRTYTLHQLRLRLRLAPGELHSGPGHQRMSTFNYTSTTTNRNIKSNACSSVRS